LVVSLGKSKFQSPVAYVDHDNSRAHWNFRCHFPIEYYSSLGEQLVKIELYDKAQKDTEGQHALIGRTSKRLKPIFQKPPNEAKNNMEIPRDEQEMWYSLQKGVGQIYCSFQKIAVTRYFKNTDSLASPGIISIGIGEFYSDSECRPRCRLEIRNDAKQDALFISRPAIDLSHKWKFNEGTLLRISDIMSQTNVILISISDENTGERFHPVELSVTDLIGKDEEKVVSFSKSSRLHKTTVGTAKLIVCLKFYIEGILSS